MDREVDLLHGVHGVALAVLPRVLARGQGHAHLQIHNFQDLYDFKTWKCNVPSASP